MIKIGLYSMLQPTEDREPYRTITLENGAMSVTPEHDRWPARRIVEALIDWQKADSTNPTEVEAALRAAPDFYHNVFMWAVVLEDSAGGK